MTSSLRSLTCSSSSLNSRSLLSLSSLFAASTTSIFSLSDLSHSPFLFPSASLKSLLIISFNSLFSLYASLTFASLSSNKLPVT